MAVVAQPRLIRLRWASQCVGCGVALPQGSEAWWDSDAKNASCESCHGRSDADAPSPGGPPTRERGVAGASVRKEYERRSARERTRKEAVAAADEEWRQRTKRDHPVVGRVASALTPKPVLGAESQATAAWKQGEAGELRVAEILDAVPGISVLHDRGIPNSRANIDHLAVGPAGVFVVDAKNYSGSVEKRDVGGWFRRDERLYVGGRDRTKVVAGVVHQMEVVRASLGPIFESVPVHGVVCFVGAQWPLVLRRPLRVNDVVALWPKALAGLVARGGPLDAAAVLAVADALARTLKPASGGA